MLTFANGTTTVSINNEPQTGAAWGKQRMQTSGRSSGGTFYAYTKPVVVETREIVFVGLTDAEKTNLETLFHSAYPTGVEGMRYTFTYTDEAGTANTVRFLSGELKFEKVGKGIWNVSFALERIA